MSRRHIKIQSYKARKNKLHVSFIYSLLRYVSLLTVAKCSRWKWNLC